MVMSEVEALGRVIAEMRIMIELKDQANNTLLKERNDLARECNGYKVRISKIEAALDAIGNK